MQIHFWKLAAWFKYLLCLPTKQEPVFFPTTTSSTTVPKYQNIFLVTQLYCFLFFNSS